MGCKNMSVKIQTRAAIHNEENRSGAGVLVLSAKTKRFLLSKRGMNCSSPETWAPFGGMVEIGEDTRAAAVRELYEEARVFIKDTDSLVDLEPLSIGSRGFVFYTYLAVVDDEPMVQINEESSGFAWFQHGAMNHQPNLHPGFEYLLGLEHTSLVIAKAMELIAEVE